MNSAGNAGATEPTLLPLSQRLRRGLAAFLAGALCQVGNIAHSGVNINTDAIKKTVTFIYYPKADGTVDADHPAGTGFFIDMPAKGQSGRVFRFLVTARHMVDPQWAQCPISNPPAIYLRLNKKGGTGVGFVRVELNTNGGANWDHPVNDNVDAAVVKLPAEIGDYDDFGIPVAMFPTDQETQAMGIGDPLLSAGLLPALPGVNHNYPIFKFGAISNIPDEPIEANCAPGFPARAYNVWIVAANLVPGNSGSPIFYVPPGGNGVIMGGLRPMLLGVQSVSLAGSDVAGMTPISYVYELLKDHMEPAADLTRGFATTTANVPAAPPTP